MADEVSGNTAALVGEHADHLVRVLRARVGQEFDIAAGESVRRGRITSLDSGRVEFDLLEEVPATDLGEITLFLAIFKFDRMEWAIEKCTELGIARIVPVVARRTDSHLAAAAVNRRERWQRVARQASEQSRRISPPEIAMPVKLPESVRAVEGLRIVLAESEERTLLRDAFTAESNHDRVALAVGPEGGWTEDELKLFQESGWSSASLGPTILRAETAAIAATAIVSSSFLSF
jgi:16S rRNA (uracil1498-N3)-methyltransferase